MTYLRSLFLNFLIVFFVDRAIPGIEISSYEEVPNIGADLIFSLVVGFLNASIFPFLAIMELTVTKMRMALMSFIFSFGSFAVIAMIPFGVRVLSFSGFLVGGAIVWAVAFFSNYLEWRHNLSRPR